ncbi:UPF0118 membrane protein YrrI [Lentibacillus sp. JNUCC-1]|uniref:AI-2E family transporter n=1 Tax=Lentibacillus sp. JNUCC-1 TaxID=2654513 RepID=UPI0012E8DC50|nr:AI-2E family transporter [Lentibacillus sp. JNUCC-1]MUV39543.1 UPF0118 membrane protein YrrI [Lentibacillus sp. JNUCC-1]
MRDQKTSLIRLIYWGIGMIIFLVVLFFFVKLTPVYGAVFSFLLKLLSPFVASCLIAYLLYPIIEKLSDWHIPKWLAILLIYLLFFGSVSYLIYLGYPMMVTQLRELNEQLPDMVDSYSVFIYDLYESTSFLPETVHDQIDQVISNLEAYIEGIVTAVFDLFTKVFDIIIFLTVIPVLVFYLLKDYQMIKAYGISKIPGKYRESARIVLKGIDQSLGNYIRGLFFVSLFVSLTSYIVFRLLDLQFALLLAIILGLTNIIPYFGPIIGAVPVVAIAATMSGKVVLIVLIALFLIQLVESNLVSPYVMGKSVRLHPIAIIFALLLGGQLGGILGMIVFVPVVTILREVIPPLLKLREID